MALTRVATRTAAMAIAMVAAAQASHALEPSLVRSGVTSADAARTETADWGSITVYTEGETAGTTSSLSAVATIKPDSEIHPPHSHVEEEYLLVTSGTGTWTLGERDFPAKAGDMLYAAPNVLHGIRSSKDGPLTFVVVKFTPKPTTAPTP